MKNATLQQLIRAYNIASALGHGWAELVYRNEIQEAFENGGMQAVQDLVKTRWNEVDSRLPCDHPMPEVASATGTGRTHWRVGRAGGVDVKVTRPAGVAFTVQLGADGLLLKIIPGRRRLAVGSRHVQAAAKIVAAAFHPGRPDWYIRAYHKLAAAILAADIPEDPEDQLRPIELPYEPIEFLRPAAALREAGYTGRIWGKHLDAAVMAVSATRPFIYTSRDEWGEDPPAVEIFTEFSTFPGRPLTDEEKAAILAAAEAVGEDPPFEVVA